MVAAATTTTIATATKEEGEGGKEEDREVKEEVASSGGHRQPGVGRRRRRRRRRMGGGEGHGLTIGLALALSMLPSSQPSTGLGQLAAGRTRNPWVPSEPIVLRGRRMPYAEAWQLWPIPEGSRLLRSPARLWVMVGLKEEEKEEEESRKNCQLAMVSGLRLTREKDKAGASVVGGAVVRDSI